MATTDERLESLESIAKGQGAQLNLLTSIGERQQTLLEQVQRDSSKTRNLWVHLCKKYGWLDDDDWDAWQEDKNDR